MKAIRSGVPLLLLACAGPPPPHPFNDLVGNPGVVTLVNLHPDEERAVLYAVNFQRDGLLPMCSAVDLIDLDSDRLIFRVRETDKTYEYVNHDAAAEPLPAHLARYFGTDCERESLEAMSKIDRQGIAQGTALVGMSKHGVTLAMGYPPKHVNPSLESNRWIYWRHRFNRIAVVFDADGRVASIQN
jgi:hypothetical protein